MTHDKFRRDASDLNQNVVEELQNLIFIKLESPYIEGLSISISGEVWCFSNLIHVNTSSRGEFLGCMVTVEMPGM